MLNDVRGFVGLWVRNNIASDDKIGWVLNKSALCSQKMVVKKSIIWVKF